MIKIEGLSKGLKEFFLENISLEIRDGEYFVILGPTGAGKTILLETIAGIYYPDKGRIFLNGKEVTDILPKERNLGMVYQDYMLFPRLTVEENIRFGLKSRRGLSKKEIRERIDRSASLLGISHLLHRYPGTLSGGEEQRVAIARALVIKPKVLLLDEPLSALDEETREKLREELKRIHSILKTTIIHVTHSFEEAFFLGDRIALMNKGEIIQVGKPNEVFRRPNSKFAADFLRVGNLFKGKSTVTGGVAEININGISMVSTTLKSGDRYISIRPEDVLVSKEKIISSARNSFKGRIESILDRGTTVRIIVDIGISFVVILTKCSFDDLGLRKGMPVYITFKASAVHIF